MFCTQCGRKFADSDKFCAECGAPREAVAPPPPDIDPSIDWRASMKPQEIMWHPEVRARVTKVAGANPQGMSGEKFYEIARPLMMITGTGTLPPLKFIKDYSLPITAKLGMKTGSELTQGFKNTFGETLAAVLCSLAARSQPVEELAEAENGCLIRSKMASSIWSWEGEMIVTLESRPEGTMVKGVISVPGQLSDMGKSKRVLQALMDDVFKYRDGQAG
ncbi:MAG: zinc ribbon domain-containing protein [Hyphomonas sp.]